MKFIFQFVLLVWVGSACTQTNHLIIGTYTTGKSEGIYIYRFNSQTGDFSLENKTRSPNPSYLAISPDKQYVYAVNEEGNNKIGGSISAFRFDPKTAALSKINQQLSGGDHPCYVAADKTGKWVTAGNYSGGSLAVLPVNADGGLAPASTVIQHTGKGTDKERQEKAHVHCTLFSPDNKFLFVPDLGIDKIMIYSFDDKKGTLSSARPASAKSIDGSGPRHLVFHPNNKYAYLVEELSGMVVTFHYKDGTLSPVQRISTLPKDYKGQAGSADIHVSINGRFLYASNRAESNTIAIFKIDPLNGKLTSIGHQSTLGKTPRNFNFDPSGNFLLVANQNSDNIIIFKIDKRTGLLTDTGKKIEVGNPVCIKWITE